MNTDSIVIGGGCFWCLDALYKRVSGVISIESGYAGGIKPNPTYEQVCAGNTEHAEVVRLTFDTNVIDIETILRIFFEIHDPTTLNRQGNDVGDSYRSIILYKDDKQKIAAEKVLKEAQAAWKDPIVTQILPLETFPFYMGEDYHQDYYAKNPNQPYCVAVISPKLEKFLKHKE